MLHNHTISIGRSIASAIMFAAILAFSSPAFTEAASASQEAAQEKSQAKPEENKAAEEYDLFARADSQYAVPDAPIGFIDGRQKMSLNGEWRLIIDPVGIGAPGTAFGGFPLNRKVQTPYDLIEYNFETSRAVQVPGDYQTQYNELTFYNNATWYYRTFSISELSEGSRFHLNFDGANFEKRVFLNGKAIGMHEGGYVPFSFDVTEALRPGENTLMVWVVSRLDDDTVPTHRIDWWPYGGLTRDVELVETPTAFIRNAQVQLAPGSTREAVVKLQYEGGPAPESARLRIPELGVDQELALDAQGQGRIALPRSLRLWSPDHPRLYNVTLNAGGDSVTDNIGFRTISTMGRQIYLNGEPIKLKGISTHEEPIGESGVAYSEAHMRRLLQEAKALNANFVRAAHYPYNRHLAKVADEVGLLLWEEVPIYWNIDFSDAEVIAVAQDQLARLVRRDWNRASVVIWSVANETPNNEARLAFLKERIDEVRTLDDTRLVSAALLGGSAEQFTLVAQRMAHMALAAPDTLSAKDRAIFEAILKDVDRSSFDDPLPIIIKDPLSKFVDIIAYNQYFGWYYSSAISRRIGVGEDVLRPLMLRLIPNLRIQSSEEKPIHISEMGAGAKLGFSGNGEGIWSETYQDAVYKAQVQMIAANPQIRGLTPWILKDFRTMVRTLPGIQDNYNRKGLIDETGARKKAFNTLRDFYGSGWDAAKVNP
ncbi:MAG: glycoside hydrolase family 2 TIM barrel-domain containing protein [Parvularcula sp.]|nr:glycoside hydrolase family 2 TIM barrel-domain containing protein [Parvularcula sp.]